MSMQMSTSDQFSRQITNMSSMMARLGVDPVALAPELLGSAMRACLACQSGEVCHDCLAQAATSPRLAPDYCPNAQIFEQVRDSQFRGSPFMRPSVNPNVMPYVYAWDVSRRDCEGSLKDAGWEGRMNDPGQPKEICCPVCGVKMEPEFNAYAYYEFEDKDDIYWASVPVHLPKKRLRSC